METSSSTSSPRPFGEIFSLWLKVFQMDESFFTAEAPRTSNSNTLLALLIFAVVAMIVGFFQQKFQPSQVFTLTYHIPLISVICLPLVVLVMVPVGFYIGTGLLHLCAKIFGGIGSFTTLAYLNSLFYIPLGIVSAVVGLIPCLGGLLSVAIAIFEIILTVRAIKVTYQLSTGRAVGTYLIPMVIFLVIVMVGMIVAVVLMGPAVGGIFSNVIHGLGTPVP